MQNLPFASQQEQVNKFLQANRVLGAQMDTMQGTTRIIYDTRPVSTGSDVTVNYFQDIAARANTLINNQPVTNLNDNRFEPGEGMVIKEIAFFNTDIVTTDSSESFGLDFSANVSLDLLYNLLLPFLARTF